MSHNRKNRVIRIFISSTFIDMSVERDLLQSEVIPELKSYCSSKGWQFECVDLRWGVSSEAQKYRKTIDICLNEIRHCRHVSPKPNFIVLLGQRYGWVPAPVQIHKADFEAITGLLEDDKAELLRKFYTLEEDVYKLAPGEDDSQVVKLLNEVGNTELRSLYYSSATELEIYEGLFSQPELSGYTILYDRILNDVPQNIHADFIENEASYDLNCLKSRIRDFIPEGRVIDKKITYDEYRSDNFASSFTAEMKRQLKDLIDNELKEYSDMDDYKVEHLFQSDMLFAHLQGNNNEVLEKIESSTSKIVVLKSVDEFKRMSVLSDFKSRHEGKTFFRTLGRSWMSSDGVGYIRSFLNTYNIQFQQSDTFLKLAERFRSALRFPDYYHIDAPEYLVLDSFDNLSANDLFLFFSWFPSTYVNTRVILSLSDLRYLSHLNPNEYQIIELEADNVSDYCCFSKTLDEICRPENNDSRFVRLAFGLIAYSHGGVTEDEILEIAPMDEDYYNRLLSVSKHDMTILKGSIQRLPYSIWSILYYHIGHMLVMRNSLSASTFTFDNDLYKDWIIRYFGQELKTHICNLIIKYFTKQTAYASTRALEELPEAYLSLCDYDGLYRLLRDESFCQRLIVNGLGENLLNYLTILRREFTDNREAIIYLDNMSDFLYKEINVLCKYAKFDKFFFSKKLTAYNDKPASYICGDYVQNSVYLRNTSEASRYQSGMALVVSYAKDYESLCEIFDIKTGRIIAMRYISLNRIIRGDSSYGSSLTHSYIKGDTVYLYDSHGFMNIWHLTDNSYTKVECESPEEMIPKDGFNLPAGFSLHNNERIISYGRVDSESFYVVTGTSLRLFTKYQ